MKLENFGLCMPQILLRQYDNIKVKVHLKKQYKDPYIILPGVFFIIEERAENSELPEGLDTDVVAMAPKEYQLKPGDVIRRVTLNPKPRIINGRKNKVSRQGTGRR